LMILKSVKQTQKLPSRKHKPDAYRVIYRYWYPDERMANSRRYTDRH